MRKKPPAVHPVVDFRRRLHLALHRTFGVHLPLGLAVAIDKLLPATEHIPDLWDGRRSLDLHAPLRGMRGTRFVASIQLQLPLDAEGRADESHIPSTYTYNRQLFHRQPPHPKDPPPHFYIRYLAEEA